MSGCGLRGRGPGGPGSAAASIPGAAAAGQALRAVGTPVVGSAGGAVGARGSEPLRAWVSQWREQQCGGLGRKHTPRAPAAFLVRRAGCVRPTCAGSAPSATSRPVAVAASLVSRLSFRLLLRESVLPRRAVGRNTRNEEANALSKRKLGIPSRGPARPAPAVPLLTAARSALLSVPASWC